MREAELLKEVQALKATVFKLNQDGGGSGGGTSPSPATSRIPVRRIRKNLPYYRAQEPGAAAGAGAGEGSGQGEPDVEMISVPRFEYEALVKEVGEQETLIAGFQLENEKLSQQLRLREDQVSVYACRCVYVYVLCMNAVYVYMYVCMHVCMNACVCLYCRCVYVYVSVHVGACMYMYV